MEGVGCRVEGVECRVEGVGRMVLTCGDRLASPIALTATCPFIREMRNLLEESEI